MPNAGIDVIVGAIHVVDGPSVSGPHPDSVAGSCDQPSGATTVGPACNETESSVECGVPCAARRLQRAFERPRSLGTPVYEARASDTCRVEDSRASANGAVAFGAPLS